MINDRFVQPQDELAKFVTSKQRKWIYHRNYSRKLKREKMPYTSDEKQEERRLKDFNRAFDYNATIYRCNTCMTPRKYGHGKPERSLVLILCAACKQHTWHSYLEIWRTRGNYAGISDNT